MTGDLDGRVAIVTGAGRGIGREEALMLGALGAHVVVNDLGGGPDGSEPDTTPANEVSAEIRARGGSATASNHDVANWNAARALLRLALEHGAELGAVVNNAGILRDRTVAKMSPAEWDAVVRVNLRGHFCVTHFALAHWRAEARRRGGPVDGRLVHTASESGLYGAPGQANYDAAKAGIAAFSLAVAREGAIYGVTSNVVCPRAYTRMTAPSFERGGDHDAAHRLHPQFIAPWVAYLVSPNSSHITGQCFVVGGGVVTLVDPWPVVADIGLPADPHDLEALGGIANELFAGRSSEPVPFPEVVPGLGW